MRSRLGPQSFPIMDGKMNRPGDDTKNRLSFFSEEEFQTVFFAGLTSPRLYS